jgi:hypothetical protein
MAEEFLQQDAQKEEKNLLLPTNQSTKYNF